MHVIHVCTYGVFGTRQQLSWFGFSHGDDYGDDNDDDGGGGDRFVSGSGFVFRGEASRVDGRKRHNGIMYICMYVCTKDLLLVHTYICIYLSIYPLRRFL